MSVDTKTEAWVRVTDADVRRLYQAIGYRAESGQVRTRHFGSSARAFKWWLLDPDGKGVKGGQREFFDSERDVWGAFLWWRTDPRHSLDAAYKIADALLGTAFVLEMYSDSESAEVELYSVAEQRVVIHGRFDPARTIAVCKVLLAFLDWREEQG